MIAVDTSALMEIVLDGPLAEACGAVLESADAAAVSAGTLAEALVAAARRGVSREMETLIRGIGLEVVPVTGDTARRVFDAYSRWGRGAHPAGLNLGDCFAYALAEERACGLLSVGEGFARTGMASPALDGAPDGAAPNPAEEGPRAAGPGMAAVRRAARADAAALAPLLGALGYPAEPAAAAARLEALLGSARDAVLVAEGEGEVLGVLALHWGSMLHLPAPVARIGSLVVAEWARNRGVGALLVREAAALAEAEGCAELELTTGMRRHAAQAFYAAQGFNWTSLHFGRTLDGGGAAR